MGIEKDDLDKINMCLEKVFYLFKSKGLKSIYLWGTVLSDEYLPNNSDVDSIGIVDDSASKNDERKIRQLIKRLAPEIKDFNFNYLYLSELNGGKIRSNLANNINPRLLLLDFNYWKHVAGKKFLRRQFNIRQISFNKAIELQSKQIYDFCLPKIEKGDYFQIPYFAKRIMKICHYLNQKEKGKHRFSYRGLILNSPVRRKKIAKKLLFLKKHNWDKNILKRNLPAFKKFLRGIEDSLSA